MFATVIVRCRRAGLSKSYASAAITLAKVALRPDTDVWCLPEHYPAFTTILTALEFKLYATTADQLLRREYKTINYSILRDAFKAAKCVTYDVVDIYRGFAWPDTPVYSLAQSSKRTRKIESDCEGAESEAASNRATEPVSKRATEPASNRVPASKRARESEGDSNKRVCVARRCPTSPTYSVSDSC